MFTRRTVPRIAAAVKKPSGARGFASEKELRDRLGTIKNISKVTKAMNMVAAAKLRKHQDALELANKFSASMEGMFYEVESDSKILVVPVSTDKGLCGGVNTFVNRESKSLMNSLIADNKEFSLFTYGGKAKGNLGRAFGKYMVGGVTDIAGGNPITFTESCEIAQTIAANEFGECKVIYNKFVNMITFDTLTVNFPSASNFAENAATKFEAYEEEGDEGGHYKNFYEFMLAVQLHGIFNNAQTCEQSSRMTAMDNSSSNADEMYEKLLLQANRVRQQKITKELMEIVAGASAVQD
mmetsp:Transcript_3757/g.6973  ORF Transcript_3757/g.6973 Transcript_3757/m.6973 type:complete len:296 (-) Transcript_3757:203-1090(-)